MVEDHFNNFGMDICRYLEGQDEIRIFRIRVTMSWEESSYIGKVGRTIIDAGLC
ncbi:hypothetical protein MtrunA17_Chr3g0132171 [Medicago truncatula]|uniref:Uncharacterized protein n=1 Tax=Medicago truncatula TaxID=3880 RepID=A0A396IXE2_MEDTR|nr:hypothetical protein MtrunA17_Chr3g0132171 [Medicago truncatula]